MTRIASVSLDLDNKWSYLKTHGSEWAHFPGYLHVVVPRVLEFLEARGLKITFFIVGQDAARQENAQPLRAIAEAGHEIGNHSFNHEPWLHLYSRAQLDEELQRAEDSIEAATGVRPSGFRGPGFSISATTLEALAARGYQYDATAFPNILNPLARAYFFARSNLSAEEKRRRRALFGTLRDAFGPIRPYRWNIGETGLLEIPVTTMPLFRVPIHLSYLLYLSRYSKTAARWYFRLALAMCRMTGTSPSLLLHPLDFLGAEDDSDLAFFPGMDLPLQRKLDVVAHAVDCLAASHEIVTMQRHAEATAGEGLKTFVPHFAKAEGPTA